MKSRRYFLIQGGLAATAMLALKPFNGFAGAASPFTGLNNSYGRKLSFLHTANINPGSDRRAIQYITNIKNSNANAILLKAGQINQDETGTLVYDASINGSNDHSAITGDYKIITKGDIKTGLISAKPGDGDLIQKINHLSAYLKKEKNCKIVVCLSQLGYRNTNAPDDITLASQSTHLDIIIGGHEDNFQKHPIIALNRNNGEVIIHAAAGGTAAIGNIEIDFDEMGRKRHISFTDQSSKNTATNRAMPTA